MELLNPAFSQPGTAVHVGDYIYDTGTLGLSSGYHLHFEVRGPSGDVPYSQGPWDDVNPEGWLFRIPQPYGQQLTSWSQGDLGEFVASAGSLYSANGYSPTFGQAPWISQGHASGQPLTTDPVTVSQSDHEWDVFAIVQGGDLGWWSYVSGVCPSWVLFNRPFPSAPLLAATAVSRYSGYLDVFAVGSNGVIYQQIGRRYPQGGRCAYAWNGWQALTDGGPPPFSSDIVAVSANDNNIYLVARAGTALWMTHFDGTGWSTWDSRGGGRLVSGGLSAVAWAASGTDGSPYTELGVFVLGADIYNNQQLYDQTYYSGTDSWSGWHSDVSAAGLFTPTTDFVAVGWASYRIDFFVRDQQYGADQQGHTFGWIWHIAYDAHITGWTSYSNLFAPPSEMVRGPGHLSVVTLGYPHIDLVAQATADRQVPPNYWHLNVSWDPLAAGP
jgi:hypothetical protein